MNNTAELENELMSLSAAQIRRRIQDMRELIEDPSWSIEAKLGAEAYMPLLQLELEAREGFTHG